MKIGFNGNHTNHRFISYDKNYFFLLATLYKKSHINTNMENQRQSLVKLFVLNKCAA